MCSPQETNSTASTRPQDSHLDRHGEEVDVLKRLDLAGLYKTAKLGARNPLLLVTVSAPAAAAAPVPHDPEILQYDAFMNMNIIRLTDT